MINIKQYDRNIESFNQAYNIAAWDCDFISPSSDKTSAYETLQDITQMKQQYILDMFPKLPKSNSRIYSLLKKDYLYSYGLPDELEEKVSQITFECTNLYREAHKKNDFNIVRNKFAELIQLKSQELNHLNVPGHDNYQKLLNYTCGYYFASCIDDIMNIIKSSLVRLNTDKNNAYSNKTSPDCLALDDIKKMFAIFGARSNYVVFQKDISNSCLQLNNEDCRLTYTDSVTSNIARHEIGHILYMQNISKKLKYCAYKKPLSQVFDEAIATIYEMMVEGLDHLKNQLFDNNPIRIHCTNMQRLLHIVLRYELERDLINETIAPYEIDNKWNNRFKEYFGYEITNDNSGILQDAHWFSGAFGYFPIYNIAFALALVLYNRLHFYDKSEKEIKTILKNNVLKYGASKSELYILSKIGVKDFTSEFKKAFSSLIES